MKFANKDLHVICDFIFQLKLFPFSGGKALGSFPPQSTLQTLTCTSLGGWSEEGGCGREGKAQAMRGGQAWEQDPAGEVRLGAGCWEASGGLGSCIPSGRGQETPAPDFRQFLDGRRGLEVRKFR